MRYSYYTNLIRQVPYGLVRRLTRKTCWGYATVWQYIQGKSGLEIGGPSTIFRRRHLIPVYGVCQRIDLCNFSEQTIWPGPKDENRLGAHFGRRFVAEASDLMPISEATYDVVLASHVLEHVANPLRALQEWNRVLRSNGTILAIVPCKWRNFDRKREFTSFEHILEDFERNVSEDDLTHIDEILSFHDLDLDPLAGSLAEFKERCAKNASVRAMHHHVFSPETLIAVFDYMRMRVLHIAVERPDHIIILAQKISPAEYTAVQSYNQSFLQPAAKWRRHDPIGASSARLQMNGRRG